ncbi:LOW QUALITY PROTEIN: hypothetical protein OSB04_013663 [Centaurea solstitialis]|uniref:Myb-like domain-containing protein n=1 Tax=Centaurea solstitialis TaxID=347529 RepID=A0AA38TDR2_9ASTR|nr:LOW QUALITY PROTEIN: hypothetical protein OSB04_013663 [Centaurea solstitialis]
MEENYMNIFPSSIPQPQPPCDLHYAMVMLGGGGILPYGSDSTTMGINMASEATCDHNGNYNGLNMEINGGCGRWPKEETRALLEIRSRLDSKFKEANQKALLWDQVSRIMSMEHGYKRSGKKCSEKFENLYKYYRKIKDGKAGSRHQNRKHYRFFRHLEALYGHETNPNANLDPYPPSLSNPNIGTTHDTFQPNPHLPNYNIPSTFDSSSCHYENRNATAPPRSWKTTITGLIEAKVHTLMEKQEAWMVKMMKKIDEKENERISNEERRRQEAVMRYEMENKFRANERARMESRDSALMEALIKLTAKECNDQNDDKYEKLIGESSGSDWEENEITQLIHIRSSMETRFEEGGKSMEGVLWEEIALTMACFGYKKRDPLICKWDDHVKFLLRSNKEKEKNICLNLSCDQQNYNVFDQKGGEIRGQYLDPQNDGGYRVLMDDDEWINWYKMKMAKGKEHI